MVGISLRSRLEVRCAFDALSGLGGIPSANAKHSSGRGHDPQGTQDLGLAGRALSKEHGRKCRKACDYRQVNKIPQGRAAADEPEVVVIDTNAILDAWWFEDPRAIGLARAVQARQLRWLATPAMRAELQDVLGRARFVTDPDRCERVLASFDTWVESVQAPAKAAMLTCLDPDDQGFIDLALAHRAAWLITRDRALLDLARGASASGCRIVPPWIWLAAAVAPTSADYRDRGCRLHPAHRRLP